MAEARKYRACVHPTAPSGQYVNAREQGRKQAKRQLQADLDTLKEMMEAQIL